MTSKVNNITELEVFCKYIEKIRSAYETLLSSFEAVRKENIELRKAARFQPRFDSPPVTLKRRKTDEDENNESRQSYDVLNNAIQDISSCLEDDVIESTPKPDVTKKDLSKKVICPRTLVSSHWKSKEIKAEPTESDSFVRTLDEPKKEPLKSLKKSDSPLRSLENHSTVGKENQKAAKWIANSFVSPSRVSRTGFISTKSPRTRLSLCKPLKQPTLDFGKKDSKVLEADTCVETFYDGSPPRQIAETKPKFLRQQYLKQYTSVAKDVDDDNIFVFKSTSNASKSISIDPLNIKKEPRAAESKVAIPEFRGNESNERSQLNELSPSSSVVALTGETMEVIVIEESQPLFDDFPSQNIYDNLELKLHPVDQVNDVPEKSKEQIILDEHTKHCQSCKSFIESWNHLTMNQKILMVERCEQKNPIRQDTDPEFWNPRFIPTPESQKQETLIDDRWTHKRKL